MRHLIFLTQLNLTQIQQQLLMQNQALTQLLQQSGPSSVSSATPMPSMMAPGGMYSQPQDLSRPGSSSPAKASRGGDSVVEAMRRQEDQEWGYSDMFCRVTCTIAII